ncbi:winged helix-turn-helix domain-containing protein [Paraburkholderia unamae]|uniref:Two-component system response regulator QseB n=1 Tax=Paraburkholderia unamae TaxID=219649 RepID=A0ABX5KUE3_9BURK|nr:winged helix-turn-helix domain-containing protein [Paraburkholderia unamae]PVX85508.1 two-component system response regulator QseB [Paraburkholderia unamae]RAR55280.1 two-component system response regulator QseB [Paraburkholderia unamae]CAG9267952.1 Transcriptional regulatory protein QseB [Paraburkholderia unamae]
MIACQEGCTTRLLLVEHDGMLAAPVVETMRCAGHMINWARDRREAESSLCDGTTYDLIMLGLGLPGDEGLDLLNHYRRLGGRAPVIILTALDAVESRIGALNAGVDDYLIKPFDLDELTARISVLMRRRTGQAAGVYAHDGLLLNHVSHEATLHGAALDLLPREFTLLGPLIEEPERVFTHHDLLRKVYGLDDEIDSNAIEVHVHRLRQKIGAQRIVTVRGVGYRLRKIA